MAWAIMLVEENEHGLVEHVHIAETALHRTFSLVMQDGAGQVIVFPSSLQQTVAEVYVLAIHEKVLVEQSYLVERLSPHHVEGTGNHLDGIGLIRIEIAHVIAAKKAAFGKKRPQSRHLAEAREGCGQSPAALGGKAAIRIEHAHPHGTHRGTGIQKIQTAAQGVLSHQRVGIEQQHILARALAYRLVVGAREAHILLVGDEPHLRKAFPQIVHRAVGAVVVHYEYLARKVGRRTQDRTQALFENVLYIVADNDHT